MDAQTFSSVLRKPSLLEKYSLRELGDLAQKHPYSSAINALIALKAHQENDGSYEYYLNQAAIRVPDRKKLYYLIHSEVEAVEKEIVEQAEVSKPIENIVEVPKEIVSSKDIISAEADSHIKITMADEVEKPVIKIKEETEISRQPEEEKPFELPGTQEIVEALKSIKESEDFREAEEPVTKIEEIKEIEKPVSGTHSFIEWLSLVKQKQSSAPPVESPVLKEIKETHSKDVIEFSKSQKIPEKAEAELAKNAQKSLTSDLEWVTETLAKVYELQKKYDKAEEAYKMLSLKFPDKKAYFAQRIENLQRRRES